MEPTGIHRAKVCAVELFSARGSAEGRSRALDLLTDRGGGFVVPEMPVDGASREAVQHDPTEKLRVRLLDLFSLGSDVAWKMDTQLHGSGLPHRHTSPCWTERKKAAIRSFLTATISIGDTGRREGPSTSETRPTVSVLV
jgi:hypothetical protein